MINKENLLGLLGLSSRAGKVISGTDACIEYINKNKIKLMILAKDASDRTKLKFNQIAESKKIPIYEFGSIDEISKSIGKKNKAIIGITDINFSKVNLKDSYASINKNGEVYIYSMHISPYEHGNIFNKDPLRARKLLLNRREINKIIGLINQKGYTLVPVSLYFKGSLVKLELGIGKGKKLYDKRQDIAKKDAEMKIRRAMKENYK